MVLQWAFCEYIIISDTSVKEFHYFLQTVEDKNVLLHENQLEVLQLLIFVSRKSLKVTFYSN